MTENQPGDVPFSPVEEEEQEDFTSLFEASSKQQDTRVQRDTKIEGTVVSIGSEWIFVDIGAKTEGAISREELLDDDGELKVRVGDTISAYVVSTRAGEVLLSIKMTAAAGEDAIRGAQKSGVPVEGVVTGERKGGYTVTIFGKQAFCPFSQIDIQSGGMPDDYIGKRFSFRIAEYSDRGRNIVVSRRAIMEEERMRQAEELKKTLKPGDIIQGTVQKLAPFGAFVDIGGVEGLIPMSELAWYRVADVSDVLKTGESVSVKVMDLDWANRRISLSMKQVLEDPWDTVAQRFPEQSVIRGTVKKLMNFGAFVELEPGIEGLIHISNLGMGRRINHPKEVLSEGDSVEARVLSVDQGARRIGLELKHSVTTEESEGHAALQSGDVVEGTVESVKDYGVFVSLPGNKTGLLHVSEIGDGRSGDLRGRFPLDSRLQVQVLSIEPDSGKISLSTKTLKKNAEDEQFKEFVSGRNRESSFGTLGQLLKDKLKQ
ncbi:30S ribosomal protein S1 [Desulfomonile tiedjei]|uniref:Ribosomal protein S1 n=1 Tax=Desulfomonile tiedjei (strain ATCC 49306 / DSM 6799 / DCB-1) TaxID=706587 RepID=I4C7J4_DESTA|nr:30S ribosomal protein S1 [Desulfomonile tiedjei]AFM25535.1 ribosomal protein S1 [Desulfomonile tiedjei DSM 6799]